MFYTLNSTEFGEHVLKSKGVVLVNFWSPWSDECRYMSSLMDDVRDLLDEEDSIVQVDWDQERKLVQELEVFGVPTLLLFVCGNEVARYYGTMSEDDVRKCVEKAKKKKEDAMVRAPRD